MPLNKEEITMPSFRLHNLPERAQAIASQAHRDDKNFLLFTKNYFSNASLSELHSRTDQEILAQLEDTYLFFSQSRKGNDINLRVHNPNHTYHSVIDVVMPDQPFLIDTLWLLLNRHNYEVHHSFYPVLKVERSGNKIKSLAYPSDRRDQGEEVLIHLEFDYQADPKTLKALHTEITSTLSKTQQVVADFPGMMARMAKLVAHLKTSQPVSKDKNEHDEQVAFLEWLQNGNFIFLGARTYNIDNKKSTIKLERGSGLGLLKNDLQSSVYNSTSIKELAPNLQRYLKSPNWLNITKALEKSIIHRDADMDFISIKELDSDGNLRCEHRFIGLFTSRAYVCNAQSIPLVRHKIENILEKERLQLGATSHGFRALVNILESYPRDELLQISENDLHRIAIGILRLNERQHARLFVRASTDECLVSAMLFVPRDRANKHLRQKIENILRQTFDADHIEYQLTISDSCLARMFFSVRVKQGSLVDFNHAELEEQVVAAAEIWTDLLRAILGAKHGRREGMVLYRHYLSAFSAAYQEITPAAHAAADIDAIEGLQKSGKAFTAQMARYSHGDQHTHLKICVPNAPLYLSEVMPIFTHMGLYVLEERPFEISLTDKKVWLHDFTVKLPEQTHENQNLYTRLTEALELAWQKRISSDDLNGLILTTSLTAKQVIVLRAYIAYLKQMAYRYPPSAVRRALLQNPAIAEQLYAYFDARFNPTHAPAEAAKSAAALEESIRISLEAVNVVADDACLRQVLALIQATVRTNAFARDILEVPLAFKLRSSAIPYLPKPTMLFEIFVFHHTMEGIHLRNSNVSRGGIRWSERHDDYRTEVLGLVKAQVVKNAVIVPSGSKGGFVIQGAKRPSFEEVQAGYTTYIETLLSVTDNIVKGKVITPENVVRHDDEDPYLVVAADKGTATFSDVANGISTTSGFWLEDAFASGGSNGYDHKKMGITARGAWECVKRHFREQGLNTQTQDFTVVGIGDMSGDVFGNGMLLSEHIRLLGAFNHLHIFVDPNPDAKTSFKERKRLFDKGRGSWNDYDPKLLSKGGAVFERSAKTLNLTKEIQALVGLPAKTTPNELMNALLKLKVDLLWNGGIGTYVKASNETHEQVGDTGNNDLRVSAPEVGAKVIGEGGNLGMTQRGRIEFAQLGGFVNTDALDNSAGVDTSDHEVNIKILLQQAVVQKKLSLPQRNKLLASMQEDVAALVLEDNYLQSQLISCAQAQAPQLLDAHRTLIRNLESKGLLKPAVEFLPDEKDFITRQQSGKGLTRPELYVICAYSKIDLTETLLQSDLPDDPALRQSYLVEYFPKALHKDYGKYMDSHRLKREIVATKLANDIVNRMGMSFVDRLMQDSGESAANVSKAYVIVRQLLGLPQLWAAIEALDNKVPSFVQYDLLGQVRNLAQDLVQWFLRHGHKPLNITSEIEHYQPHFAEVRKLLPKLMTTSMRNRHKARVDAWTKAGVPQALASTLADTLALACAADVSHSTRYHKLKVEQVMPLYFAVGEALGFGKLHMTVDGITITNGWQRTAATAAHSKLYAAQKRLTGNILKLGNKSPEEALAQWQKTHGLALNRYNDLLSSVTSTPADFAMLNVVVDQLERLI